MIRIRVPAGTKIEISFHTRREQRITTSEMIVDAYDYDEDKLPLKEGDMYWVLYRAIGKLCEYKCHKTGTGYITRKIMF